MLRKLFTITAVSVVASASLLAAGCESNTGAENKPYGLTGSSEQRTSSNQLFHGKGPINENEWQYKQTRHAESP